MFCKSMALRRWEDFIFVPYGFSRRKSNGVLAVNIYDFLLDSKSIER